MATLKTATTIHGVDPNLAEKGPFLSSVLQKGTGFNSLLAGATAGGVEAAITYPFEWAKTRVQLREEVCSGVKQSPTSVIRNSIARDGPLAIYKGCSSLVVGTALKSSVRFFTFDTIKAQLADHNGKLSFGSGILAGVVAGGVESVFAVTPTERIKTAIIDDAKGAKRFRSTRHAIQVMIQEHGLRSIYRGLVSTTIKQCATSAVRMGSYNVLKTTYQQRYGHPQATQTFLMGAVAGTITVYTTQPFDTIKTRAQGARSETMLRAIRSVFTEYGVNGFWKGSTMRLGRLMLSGGIVFSVYEQVSLFLHTLSKTSAV